MEQENTHKKFKVKDLFNGKILLQDWTIKKALFASYIFFLIIAYITVNIWVQNTQVEKRRNQTILKNYKADYTSKTAKLQFESKRGEVAVKLKELGSTLQNPTKPARVVKLENNYLKND